MKGRDEEMQGLSESGRDAYARWAMRHHPTNAGRRDWLAEVAEHDGQALANDLRQRMARIYRDEQHQGEGKP